MDDLTAMKPIYVNGKWLPQGSPIPGGMMGFDYEKAARKGMIASASGAEIVNPASEQEQAEVSASELRVTELEAELAAVRAELEAAYAQGLLPEDALQRIVDVKGVGEKLAPVILDALTAPATE